MSFDPRLYRQFLLRVVHEGRAPFLAAEFHVSQATIYRMRRQALSDGAIKVLGECAYSADDNYPKYVDHIDTAYGGFDSHSQLSEPRLSGESQGRAHPRLLPGWTHTGAECTYVIWPPVPPDLATKLKHWGRSWRHQETSRHGTAQFYVGKNAASVVLHMAHRDYPDGLEDQVPKFQAAEFREWIQELLEAYPGLQVVNRPIFHPDPKAQESRTPLPSGELVKRIHGVETVAKERVGPATETNNSPPGPAVETAGIDEARAIARAPFVLEDLRKDIATLKESVDGIGNAVQDLVKVLAPKPPEPPAPPPDTGEHPEFG